MYEDIRDRQILGSIVFDQNVIDLESAGSCFRFPIQSELQLTSGCVPARRVARLDLEIRVGAPFSPYVATSSANSFLNSSSGLDNNELALGPKASSGIGMLFVINPRFDAGGILLNI
jgi:hypothetical protein